MSQRTLRPSQTTTMVAAPVGGMFARRRATRAPLSYTATAICAMALLWPHSRAELPVDVAAALSFASPTPLSPPPASEDCAADSFLVVGAGFAAINGCYQPNGSVYGSPLYSQSPTAGVATPRCGTYCNFFACLPSIRARPTPSSCPQLIGSCCFSHSQILPSRFPPFARAPRLLSDDTHDWGGLPQAARREPASTLTGPHAEHARVLGCCLPHAATACFAGLLRVDWVGRPGLGALEFLVLWQGRCGMFRVKFHGVLGTLHFVAELLLRT